MVHGFEPDVYLAYTPIPEPTAPDSAPEPAPVFQSTFLQWLNSFLLLEEAERKKAYAF